MIPQHRPQTVSRAHLLQQHSARLGVGSRLLLVSAERRHSHEVPRQHNQIRTQSIDHADCCLQWVRGKVRIVMEVAQNDDGEALQLGGPATKLYLQPHHARVIGLDKKRISGDGRDSGSRGETDKPSSVSRKKCQSIFRPYSALRDSWACPHSSISRTQRFAICRE